MVQINVKRVYEDYSKSDGFRVLVDRLWPRGMKKEHLHYDLWAKGITPSSELREWFHQDPENRWKEFAKSYEKELSESEEVKDFVDQIKDKKVITLLYASKEPEHNHAKILKAYLDKVINK